MTQLKKKRTIVEVLLFFVGVLVILITSVYPTSHSRFIDENNNALSYETKLYTLYKGTFGDFRFNEASTYKSLRLSFDLKRNTIAKANEKDVYTIEVPYGCYISGLKNTSSTSTKNQYELTFGAAEQNRTLQMVCNLSVDYSGVKSLNLPVSVYEKIENEAMFLYQNNAYITSNYYNIRPLPQIEYTETDLQMPVDSRLKKKVFESWISDYVNAYISRVYPTLNEEDATALFDEFYDFALQYIETVYKTDADYVKLPSTPLKGLQVTFDATANVYHYHIENNFLGYAKTTIWGDSNSMYFSTTIGKEINEAFDYHLKNAYPNAQDQAIIKEYVNNYSKGQGIAYIVLPNTDGTFNKISGFDYFYEDDKQLYLDERLIDYAYSYKNNISRINNALSKNLRKTTFIVNMRNVYKDKMSEDIYNSLIADDSEILTLALDKTQDEFHQTFMIYDTLKKQSLYIEVFSNLNDSYNYVKIQFIEDIDSITLSLLKDSNSIKAVVSDTTIADLNAFVNQLALPDDILVTVSNDTLDTSIFIKGATVSELLDILKQMNEFLASLKQNSDVTLKEEEELIPNPTEEGVKE